MNILKIVQRDDGEVAYLFDGERVIKVFVDDLTHTQAPRRETLPAENDIFEEAQPRRRTRPVKMPDVDVEDEQVLPYPPPSQKRKPNIMPSNLRGVFLKPEMPGAAVERREVGS